MNSSAAVQDLCYSDIEDELRASVRSLLAKHAGWETVLARTESEQPGDIALWRKIGVELQLAGLAVPESRGGAGAGWREVAVVCEELGRTVAPVPYLGSAVIATALLLELDAPDVLAAVAAGARTAALIVPFHLGPFGSVGTSVSRRANKVTGTVTSVADASDADTLLVFTADSVCVVAADAPGVTRTPVVTLDMTRPLTDFDFHDVDCAVIGSGVAAQSAVRQALLIGAALLASEQIGAAQRCLEMTVEYLKMRRQFNRVIGSYQSIKHRLADLTVAMDQAVAVARYAAGCAASDSPDLPVAVALAQAHCSAVGQLAAEECLQLHGGIGFTWEHPVHLYLKRAKSTALALGTVDRHRAALASLIDVPPPVPLDNPEH